MNKAALLFFSLLALTLAALPARAEFEQDLTATANTANLQALRELHARATAGDADAQLNMGGLFFKGQEVAQDYAEAAKWFSLAARQGQPQAQFNLGMMYATGQGVIRDQATSVQWYLASAKQGLALAQLNLGVAYATGQGVALDEAVAAKWFRLAAVQGEAQAQFNLAVMYANGQGVAQNLPAAYHWSKLAADQGHETASTLTEDLSRQMTPEQMASAGKLADIAPESGDIYLQLAAFKSYREAEKYLEKIRAKLGEIGKPYSIYTSDGWMRVHVGPYVTPNEARRSAATLKERLGSEPMLKRH